MIFKCCLILHFLHVTCILARVSPNSDHILLTFVLLGRLNVGRTLSSSFLINQQQK